MMAACDVVFPFLFGGTFIEGAINREVHGVTFSFPFLFGGTFIEGSGAWMRYSSLAARFPFLFGGTFIEGSLDVFILNCDNADFPSFSEGLSLRALLIRPLF